MHVYKVCEKLPISLLWEPWDMKPKLHEMTVQLIAMFLPGCREARRQEVGLRVLDIVKATVPDEVFLREQWIPRPHRFKRILVLSRELEVGPYDAVGLKPIHGIKGYVNRMTRFGLLSCLSLSLIHI